MSEVKTFLLEHLESIFRGDFQAYARTTIDDLSLYEWHVTPHRIDGLSFHEFIMSEVSRTDSAAIALDPSPSDTEDREGRMNFDLANYREQRYGDVAICSYTMLISRGTKTGVAVQSYNESRVLVVSNGTWQVVHVHKSPSWAAPFQP